MKRKAAALLMGLLFFLAACGGQKPKPPGGNGWQEGPIALTTAPELDLGTCKGVSSARTQEWGVGGLPERPEDTLILLAAGHGPNGKRPPYTTCFNSDGSEQPLPAVAGKNEIQEDELTMALTLRLEAVLKRLGFPVELIRYGDYGTEGECAQKALFRKSPLVRSANSNSRFCDGWYLSVRGRSDVYELDEIKQLCANDPACIHDVLIPGTEHAISRAGQLIRDHAARLGITYDPAGENSVNSPKVAYISIHFNSVAAAGDGVGTMLAMFSGTVRHQENGYRSNPALTFQGPNHAPLGSVAKNYVASVFEYMFHSLRESGALPEARGKRVLVYQNVDLVNQSHRAQPATPYSFKSNSRQGPLNDSGDPIKFHVNPPNPGVTGPVTVVSGLGSKKEDYAPNKDVISIPNNVTLEVAHYRDCRNAVPLLQSLQRPIMNPDFDADTTPLDPTDPLDVAAMDIAHGLVEYYASYMPEFKERACENLRASDWAAAGWKLPDWCGTPEIDAVTPDRFQAELRVGDETQATLSFENTGDGDLDYRVHAGTPLADLGTPTVVPAGTIQPLGNEQSGTLPPGHRAELEVTLRCPSSGRQSGTITIFSNDPDESRIDIPIELNCLPVPELAVPPLPLGSTALNYLLPADVGTGGIASDVFDFAEAGGEAELHYRLTLPDWLHLSPTEGTLPPGGRYLDQVDPNATARCDAVGEREGVIVIETDDPRNPRVEVPVRLMCAELEAEFQPADYNPSGTPLPERCPPLSDTIRIRGADHLQEMYAELSNGGIRYRKPEFTYVIEHPNYTTRRWPILHAPGDPTSTWDWSAYPNFAFTSFVQSCAFDLGEHTVNTFDLVHPRWQENPPDGRGTYGAHLTAPTGFAIHDNRFPGVIYDYARLCDDQGNCTEYDVDILLRTTGFADQSLSLEYGSWDWALHPLAARFQEEVTIRQGSSVAAEGNYLLGPIFDPTQLRYCRILKTDRLRDHTGGYLYPPGMPPVFWGQTVELVEYAGSLNVWLVEAMHEPICYDPWDPGAGPRAPWANQTRIRPTPTRPLVPTGEGHFRRFFDRGQ